MPRLYTRRDFLKTSLKGAGLLALGTLISPQKLFRGNEYLFAETKEPDLYILQGTDYKKLIREAFICMGGIKKFVKTGNYVVIKPNAAWERKPEEAGNTHPDLVAETVRLCLDAGARKVDVIDHTCDNWKNSFKISGIEDAVKKAGGNMISLAEARTFKEVIIEKAKILKKAMVAEQVLSADCFINMPIAKDHSASTLTMSMKNYMGIVKDRLTFHIRGLHQCIADIASFVKPTLVIMDCTRILLTNGPKGPGKVKILNKIIIGKDHVAVDSFGATFFGFKPRDIGHIKIAEEMGIGKADLENLNIEQKNI